MLTGLSAGGRLARVMSRPTRRIPLVNLSHYRSGTPEERARTRAALRRIDQTVVVPASNGFRSAEGHAMFKDRLFCAPDAAPGNKAYAADGLRAADRTLADQPFVAGDRFTLADILLFCFVEFAAQVGQAPDPALGHLARWRERVAARPSAAASPAPTAISPSILL